MERKIEYAAKTLARAEKNTSLMQLNINSSKMHIIHRATIQQLSNKRQGNANCKTRGEVRGGGKKPWKQKGTGRARAGSIRSPLWKGGGAVFGPKTKHRSSKINKKERKLAIRNMLLNKKDFTFTIESSQINISEPKTKMLIANIKKIGLALTDKILVITVGKNRNMFLAGKNLKNIEITSAQQLNLLSIIKAKNILIETDAIKVINQKYNE